MRIGIDCRKMLNIPQGEVGGIAHYINDLVRHVVAIGRDHQFVLFSHTPIDHDWLKEYGNVHVRIFPLAKLKPVLPYAYAHVLSSAVLERETLDVFHAPTLPFPLNYKGRVVSTVHDLAIYDHPEWFPKAFGTHQVFSTRVGVPRSLAHSRFIIAVSRFTAGEVEKRFSISPRRIRVIYEAVERKRVSELEQQEARTRFRLPGRYILHLGTIEPRKNIQNLLEAYHECVQQDIPVGDLILAGSRGWNNAAIFRSIETINKQIRRQQVFFGHAKKSQYDAIRYLGPVSEQEKWALLKGALCFVFPTFYEGFGLPPLEAMSMGIPVITSNTTSVPEVVGTSAVLVDPNDVDGLFRAMKSVARSKSLRASMVAKGRRQARLFSWERAAEETLNVYEDAFKRV